MNRYLRLVPLVLATISYAMPALAETHSTANRHRDQLELIAEFPAGTGPFPALVLAPGQGYHMAMPAMEQMAKQLLAHGVAVFRFNWTYFTKDPKAGQPSADLSFELKDLHAVVNIARAEPRVAKDKLSIGGKSLGSVVAWKALTLDRSLRSGLFLTPVCSRLPAGQTQPTDFSDENYPGITTEQRPLLFIVGDQDPLCAQHVLYAFAARAASKARVVVVGGDHSFGNKALTGPAFDAARDRNIRLLSLAGASFVVEKSSD